MYLHASNSQQIQYKLKSENLIISRIVLWCKSTCFILQKNWNYIWEIYYGFFSEFFRFCAAKSHVKKQLRHTRNDKTQR